LVKIHNELAAKPFDKLGTAKSLFFDAAQDNGELVETLKASPCFVG
jgi:hypothetical protein